MADKLNIISSDYLTDVSESEINALIDQIIEKSKNNMDEICALTLECTALLSSAENRSEALNSQGTFMRLVGNLTGKNQKLQNAILQDNTNALYAAQGIINKVMIECTSNRQLLIAVNDRVSDLYLELKEKQNDISAVVLMNRQAIAAFYKKYQDEILAQDERISRMENYEKSKCPKCQSELLSWQKICSYCGYIHPLKIDNSSEETKQILSKLSEIINDKKLSEDIVWDVTVRKTERLLRKVKAFASIGQLPGYTEELDIDIENLLNKCRDAVFQIAVVGVMKAGKSFLMNALIGAEIASVDINPETAALTKFRSAKGYYINVKFHNKKQWEKLKESAQKSNKESKKDSLAARLNDPAIAEMESKWVGHEVLHIECETLHDLQNSVKKYTSSQVNQHLFVSEVEVGVDRSIFNMPPEVVFVDTPGLKDPVKYRSNITKEYIRKADAVLVALKPGPLTAEGLEIVTTVLDCTDTRKAFIVGTQKDLNTEDECAQYVFNWIEHLVDAKRYKDKRNAGNRILLTSAKMDLLVNKWFSLSEKEKEDEGCFSADDYNDLQSYAGKILKKRGYNLMQMSEEDFDRVSESTGIPALRKKLDGTLIANYRKLKREDIQEAFARCKKHVEELSEKAIILQKEKIRLSMADAEELRAKICSMEIEKNQLKKESAELKKEAEKLENAIFAKIKEIERNTLKDRANRIGRKGE